MAATDPDGNPDYTYVHTADVIAARISAGCYSSDDGRLPGERALAAELGVSYLTCRHAMQVLRDRGLIITLHGRETFLAPDPAGTTMPGPPSSPAPSGRVTRPGDAAMRHRDQAPQQDPGPPRTDPARVFRAFLAADTQLVIRAAPAHRLRLTLASIAGHLCDRVRLDLTGPLPPGPVSRAVRGVRDAASAGHAGVRLYHHAGQVIAASCLHVLGFDSHQAAAGDTYFTTIVQPALAAASRQRMRGLLLDLAAHIEATMDAADTITTPRTEDRLTGETQKTRTGVFAAAGSCQHATMIQAAHLLSMLLDGLTSTQPAHSASTEQTRLPPAARRNECMN